MLEMWVVPLWGCVGVSDDTLTTVLKWHEPNGVSYRVRIGPRPGSAHWNIVKEGNWNGSDGWQRLSGTETRTKPEVTEYE